MASQFIKQLQKLEHHKSSFGLIVVGLLIAALGAIVLLNEYQLISFQIPLKQSQLISVLSACCVLAGLYMLSSQLRR